MGYFQNPRDDSCACRREKWEAVIDEQIKGWPEAHQRQLGDLEHHLEAKALFMFSLTRRTINYMVAAHSTPIGGWKAFYPQGYSLIFPIMEMFGKAVWPVNRKHEKRDGVSKSDQYIGLGLMWLYASEMLQPSDFELVGRSKFLTGIRNYLLHGTTSIEKNDDIKNMDAGEPYRIAVQLEGSMRSYWNNLRDDEGHQDGWIHRLAEAQVNPFFIPGSSKNKSGEFMPYHFEKCLIDSDIVNYLENKSLSVFDENKHSS